MLNRFYGPVLLLFLLSGCSAIQIAADSQSQESDYNKAIADAAVIAPSEIKTLPVISTSRLKVVTWTAYTSSYTAGQPVVLTWGDVWVTLDGAVQSRCREFSSEQLVSDLKKLLGLPLGNMTEKRSFVTLEVDSAALFRPCADPDIQADKCTADFPENIAPAHSAWYAHQTARSYQTDKGYPWTRLGYTYNWQSGESEVGPAEFVIKQNSTAVTISIADSKAYCRQ